MGASRPGYAIKLQEEWPSYVGPSIPCPLSFTADDKKQKGEDETKWASGVEPLEEFLSQVGPHSNY